MKSTHMYQYRKVGKVSFWQFDFFQRLHCQAWFFNRPGGVSQGRYQGLNLGYHTQDLAERVKKNRQLAQQAARFGPWSPVLGQQVHGNRIRIVSANQAGRGWFSFATALPRTDGLMTRVKGLPLAVLVADCLPVLLAAEKSTAIAAVHAGWRGIVNQIIPKTVKKFKRHFQVEPKQLWAAIGPAIGPERFIIKKPVLQQLKKIFPQALHPLNQKESAGFDLWQVARLQLIQAGVKPRRIITLRECTASHPRKYYSHRRDGETGRMMAMIQIE